MGRIGLFVVGWALVTSCGSKPRPEVKPAPALIADSVVVKQPVTPMCGPPIQAAVVQVSEDSDESRLVVVEVATGKLLWQGPIGSGSEGDPLWSSDGRFLVFQVEGKLFVHEDGKPDRKIFPASVDVGAAGVAGAALTGDGDPGEVTTLAVSATQLAAVTPDGLILIDLRAESAPALRRLTLDCMADQLSWSPDGGELVGLCADAEPNLLTIDVTSGNIATASVDNVDKLLGWRGQPAELLVEVDGVPRLVKGDGKSEALRIIDEEDPLELGPYVAGADRFLQAVTLDEPGYVQVVWLSEIGEQPPLPWLRSTSTDFGFSSDGGWALFTAVEEMGDDWGDIYLARVGRSKVERVLTAPYSDSDEEDDEAGAGGEEDEDSSAPIYGFRAPRPRPMLRKCQIVVPAARIALVEETRVEFAELDAELLPGGAVIISGEDDQMHLATLFDRIPLDVERMGDIHGATVLDNDNIAILGEDGSQTTVWVVGPTGQDLWNVAMPSVDAVYRQRDGGLAIHSGPDLRFYDAEGALIGKTSRNNGVEYVRSQADGSSILIDGAGDTVIIDRSGKELVKLPDDGLFEPAVMADGTIVRGVETDDAYLVGFFARSGKQRGQYDLGDNEVSSAPLALPNNTVVLTLEAESPSLLFLDSRGRVTGSFALGEYGSGAEPVVFDDSSLVVAANSQLYVVGANGEYQGGRVMKSMIEMGPYVAGPNHVVVMTDEAILFLRRELR